MVFMQTCSKRMRKAPPNPLSHFSSLNMKSENLFCQNEFCFAPAKQTEAENEKAKNSQPNTLLVV